NQQIISITNPSTPTRFWNGVFSSPAVYANQFTSRFGTRRTYHGIGTDLVVEGFHAGLDFAGGEGLQIFAPAPGRIVFAAPLTVRGNATVIDHGWGVYSGIWHQSEILVNVGDVVEQGQVIGLVGGTGRVTGAHLHWEIWVNGVQVNPMDWLNQAYP
ncbi:MAG TPA: M23 family metallopeptidase, partial [Anaerolineales bacterium]|nr:M23 family metallopeptidase [Anaerolineales bacterium]